MGLWAGHELGEDAAEDDVHSCQNFAACSGQALSSIHLHSPRAPKIHPARSPANCQLTVSSGRNFRQLMQQGMSCKESLQNIQILDSCTSRDALPQSLALVQGQNLSSFVKNALWWIKVETSSLPEHRMGASIGPGSGFPDDNAFRSVFNMASYRKHRSMTEPS